MTKLFDELLQEIDNAAEENLDGRKYSNKRRDAISRNLSEILRDYRQREARQFKSRIIDLIESRRLPEPHHTDLIAERIVESNDYEETPEWDSNDKYSLFK